MKVKIKERKKNPLLGRRTITGTIDHTDEPTPSSESLKSFLAEDLGSDEENIEIDKIFTLRGMQKSKFWVKEFGESFKEPKEDDVQQEDGSETNELEKILGGSISDAKEAIDEMDSPDFELLLEIEEANKDRKGMKKYLEGQIGE